MNNHSTNDSSVGHSTSLADIFSPRGVAVVGATPGGSYAAVVIEALKGAGFPAIYPVNPKYPEVLGLPCYPSVQAIPNVVDHVIAAIPAASSLALLDDCAAKGVRSVQFFTAGFSEAGTNEGMQLEVALLNKARAGRFRIIGPNSTGLFVPKSLLVSGALGAPLEPGSISFISQSGGHADTLPFFGGPRGLRFSKVVSYGNALDVDESELLEYLSQDTETDIIAAYIEGLKDGSRFKNVLEKACSKKPVIIYRGGIAEAANRIIQSHTASFASTKQVFNSLCQQMNVVQVDDIEELIDILVAYRFLKPFPQGTSVAVMGFGGGPSVHAIDVFETLGLHVPLLSQETQNKLRQISPLVGSIVSNPLDSLALLSSDGILSTLRILGDLPEIHLIAFHLGFHSGSRWGSGQSALGESRQSMLDALIVARQQTGKPVLLIMHPAPDLIGTQDFLNTQSLAVEKGIPVFYSFQQAAKAISRLAAWNSKKHNRQ